MILWSDALARKKGPFWSYPPPAEDRLEQVAVQTAPSLPTEPSASTSTFPSPFPAPNKTSTSTTIVHAPVNINGAYNDDTLPHPAG